MRKYLLSLLALSMLLGACGGNEPFGPDTPPDPPGTVKFNVINANNGGNSFYDISIDKDNNFVSTHWELVIVGAMRGIGNLNSIPLEGFESTVAVKPGYSYIGRRAITHYTNQAEYNRAEYQYIGFYVDEYIRSPLGANMGATVRYIYDYTNRNVKSIVRENEGTEFDQGGHLSIELKDVIPYVIDLTYNEWVKISSYKPT